MFAALRRASDHYCRLASVDSKGYLLIMFA